MNHGYERVWSGFRRPPFPSQPSDHKMDTDPISIQTQVLSQSKGASRGAKRAQDNNLQDSPVHLPSPESPAPSCPLKDYPAKRRGIEAAETRGAPSTLFSGGNKPVQRARSPYKRFETTSTTPAQFEHPPIQPSKQSDLKYRRTQHRRRGQGQWSKIAGE